MSKHLDRKYGCLDSSLDDQEDCVDYTINCLDTGRQQLADLGTLAKYWNTQTDGLDKQINDLPSNTDPNKADWKF